MLFRCRLIRSSHRGAMLIYRLTPPSLCVPKMFIELNHEPVTLSLQWNGAIARIAVNELIAMRQLLPVSG